MRQAKGFTLIELLIAVVVIGILAAIALPNYTDYITRSKFAEAHGQLSDLRVKMEQYYMDNRRYSTTVGGGTCGVAMPAATQVKYFTYSCASSNANAAGDQQYVITASGVAVEGLAGISFTIIFFNTTATTVTGGSAMATKGYADNAACWVRKKPSNC